MTKRPNLDTYAFKTVVTVEMCVIREILGKVVKYSVYYSAVENRAAQPLTLFDVDPRQKMVEEQNLVAFSKILWKTF